MKHIFFMQYHRFLLLLSVILIAQTGYAAQLITVEADPAIGFTVKVNGNFDESYTYLMHSVVPVNFSDIVFDSDGKPTMDELYVFLTLPPEAEPLLGLQGEIYLCCSAYNNAVYLAVDVNPAGNRNFVFTGCNGKRLYFTGKCSNACPGFGSNDDRPEGTELPKVLPKTEGVFYLTGTDGEKVDIYLHNFNVKVRNKKLEKFNLLDMFTSFIKGSGASVFAIGSCRKDAETGEDENRAFTANFHIVGENTLTGGNVSRSLGGDDAISKVLAEIFTLHNSPIAIRPLVKEEQGGGQEGADAYANKATKLIFDDVVPIRGEFTHTNGKLNLPMQGSYSTPAIDLGNSKGYCEFNGGQYQLQAPVSNSMFYVCSMAICYKQFFFKGNTYFGVGSSVGTSTSTLSENRVRVRINDGSFSTYPAPVVTDGEGNMVDPVAHGWYQDYTDLRLPYESRINGGTFNNCRVYRCDASAEQGNSPVNNGNLALCYKELKVPAGEGTNGALSKEQVASLPLLSAATGYGTASLTPVLDDDGKYYLHTYLPLADCDEEVTSKEYIHNWVTVIPQMGAKDLLTMGGDVYVHSVESDSVTPRKNAYLFYARLNEYTKQHASVNLGVDIPVQAAIKNGGPHEFTSVTNSASYQIAHGLYTMLSFNTNQWYTLTMPYDVANIYVIETTDTQRGANETLEQFLIRQGQADGKLASTIITSLCPDILSGKGSGVYMNLIEIARKQLNCEPIHLTHYNPAIEGHGAKDAHFYLYETKTEDNYDPDYDDYPYWNISAKADDYANKWQCATLTPYEEGKYKKQDGTNMPAGNIVMRKGEVYSLLLPDSEASRYWDGKYLIFEGYGEQKILGTNTYALQTAKQDDLDEDWLSYDKDRAVLQGNCSFANETIEEQVFIPTCVDKDYIFERKDAGYVLLPCEVKLVMSESNTAKYEAITREGKVQRYAPGAAVPTQDGLPQVNNISLVATATHNTIRLQAYDNLHVSVYTIDGRVVYNQEMHDGSDVTITVPMGVYVIGSEAQTCKLVVP